MARIDWTNISISGKEFIYVVSACFALSGMYYKFYYSDIETQKTYANDKVQTGQALSAHDSKIKMMEEQIRALQDSELQRKTREETNQSSHGYIPFKKE